MARWEYAELRASREFAIAAYLSEVASAGWEVVAVTEEGTRIYTLRRQVR